MLLELITPLMIASAPIKIDVPQGTYDHAAQVSTYKEAQYRPPTWNQTQTYDFQGRPHDADND